MKHIRIIWRVMRRERLQMVAAARKRPILIYARKIKPAHQAVVAHLWLMTHITITLRAIRKLRLQMVAAERGRYIPIIAREAKPAPQAAVAHRQ